MHLLFDAHLDLAMNALEWNRDLCRPLRQIRARERHLTDKPDRGRGTVSFEEMRRANIGLCAATLIARFVKPGNPLPGWHSQEQAFAQTQGQLAWYRAMEDAGELVQIRDKTGLRQHLENWQNQSPGVQKRPIGYILTLEGADSVLRPDALERAFENGLRAVGPAHYGPGVYAFGTDSVGPMGKKGRALLQKMQELGLILDATHLCDQSFWEAMRHFQGHVWASHHLTRRLTPHNRQLDDDQIRHLIARRAVIGLALDAWMIVPGWVRGQSTPRKMGATLDRALDHLDHICQLAGNADHVGIGSDLDGGFGLEQSPGDLKSIADLQKIPALLQKRGFSPGDVEKVMHKNWLAFLERAW